MKDSQLIPGSLINRAKYIKADNERFSTPKYLLFFSYKYIKADNERFSTC